MQQQGKTNAHNLRMLSRKLADGESLTPEEKAAVDAAAAGTVRSGWALNQVQLANALGVSRQSIQVWRREGAPAPTPNGQYDIEAWREWAAVNGRNERQPSKPDKKKESALNAKIKATARRLQLQNEKLETEIGILKRKYLPADEVERDLTVLIAGARRVGEQMPASLAPQLAGLDVLAIEKRLRDWWDEFCDALHRGEAEKE